MTGNGVKLTAVFQASATINSSNHKFGAGSSTENNLLLIFPLIAFPRRRSGATCWGYCIKPLAEKHSSPQAGGKRRHGLGHAPTLSPESPLPHTTASSPKGDSVSHMWKGAEGHWERSPHSLPAPLTGSEAPGHARRWSPVGSLALMGGKSGTVGTVQTSVAVSCWVLVAVS